MVLFALVWFTVKNFGCHEVRFWDENEVHVDAYDGVDMVIRRLPILSENMMRNGFKTDDVDTHALMVKKEIEDIKDQIKMETDGPKGNILTTAKSPRNCEGSVSKCKFSEIVRESPIAMFIHSSSIQSRQFVNIIRSKFDIYPEILVIDLDSDIDGPGVADHIKSIDKYAVGSHASLFANGKLVETSSFQSNINSPTEQTAFYEHILELGMDNIKITRKMVPSNI